MKYNGGIICASDSRTAAVQKTLSINTKKHFDRGPTFPTVAPEKFDTSMIK